MNTTTRVALLVAMAWVAMAGSAFAVTTIHPSKSNSDALTSAECAQKGGKVYTDAAGKNVCVTVAVAAKVTTVKGSKSNSSFRRTPSVTEAECTAKGGVVLTSTDGTNAKICVAAADQASVPAIKPDATPAH